MSFAVHDTQFIRYSFQHQLQAAIDTGQLVESESGLDPITLKAVDAVAHSYPHTDAKLVSKALAELESQLNGSHEARLLAVSTPPVDLTTRRRKTAR